jgi:predicted PurR-regulated permease PerM
MKVQDQLRAAARVSRAGPLEWMRWIPAFLLLILIGVMLLVGGRIILVPLLCSLALAYLLEPGVEWFERRGWSRTTSVLLTLTLATLAVFIILVFLLPGIWGQLVKSYHQLPQALDAGHRLVDPLILKLKTASPPVYEFLSSLSDRLKTADSQAQIGATVGRWLQSGLFRLVDVTASILDLLLIPFFVFYLLSDYLKMRAYLEQLIPPRHRVAAVALFGQINHVLSAYVRSQLVIALTMGLLYAFGFAVLRVPLALTLGLLSGVLNFIPYLGTLTGLALSLSFTALDGAGPARLIGVVAVFAVVQSIEGYYLTPRFLGSKLNLHPLWVLAGLVIGGNLFGLLGIILAVPVIAAAKVILHFVEEEVYRNSDFYLRAGGDLITEQGQPILITPTTPSSDLSQPAETASSPSEKPERRVILTTGELRTRLREGTKPQPE